MNNGNNKHEDNDLKDISTEDLENLDIRLKGLSQDNSDKIKEIEKELKRRNK